MCVTHPQILKLDRLQPHPSGLPVPKAISASGAHLLPSNLRAGGESLISKGQWVAYWQKGGYALKKKKWVLHTHQRANSCTKPLMCGFEMEASYPSFPDIGTKSQAGLHFESRGLNFHRPFPFQDFDHDLYWISDQFWGNERKIL